MKRFAALALVTMATGAAVGMVASPAAAGDHGYGYGYDKSVSSWDAREMDRGHGDYGYYPKDDKGWDKDWNKGKGWDKDKDKGYGYY